MSSRIFQLTVVASRRPGVKIGTAQEQQDSLLESHAVFAAAKVSGLAIVKPPRILCHIEGPEPKVMEMFARLEKDPRIYGIVALQRRFGDSRNFDGMHFAVAPGAGNGAQKPLVDQLTELLAGVPEDLAQNLLAFARLKPGRAA